MKYILSFFILLFANCAVGKAQDVYNLVLENATRIVNSPTSGYTQIQIAQFKRTALIYLKRKAFEQYSEVTSDFLDTQAYYLSEFITLFFDDIIKSNRLSDDKRKEHILMFMDASISNPLFVELDQDTSMSFITNGGEITPFSLNTNWEKAFMAAKACLK